MTIKKTLESFDENFTHNIYFYCDYITTEVDKEEVKDFIKEAIIQAIDEITPEMKNEELDITLGEKAYSSQQYAKVWNAFRDKIIENKTKFLNN